MNERRIDAVTILLVQKDKKEIKNLQRYVEKCYPQSKIVAFDDSQKAIDFINSSSEPIDLCFTKVKMNGISGIQIATEIREYDKNTKVVFISDSREYALDAWKLGVCDYLLEPVTLESVKHTLKSTGFENTVAAKPKAEQPKVVHRQDDKELRKLSRLEILELLLEQTKLNEQLKAENKELKDSNREIRSENSAARSIETLERISDKMCSSLEHADSLTQNLQKMTEDGAFLRPVEVRAEPEKTEPVIEVMQQTPVATVDDENLYCRIINFYLQPENKSCPLSNEILGDVRTRLRGILNARG